MCGLSCTSVSEFISKRRRQVLRSSNTTMYCSEVTKNQHLVPKKLFHNYQLTPMFNGFSHYFFWFLICSLSNGGREYIHVLSLHLVRSLSWAMVFNSGRVSRSFVPMVVFRPFLETENKKDKLIITYSITYASPFVYVIFSFLSSNFLTHPYWQTESWSHSFVPPAHKRKKKLLINSYMILNHYWTVPWW